MNFQINIIRTELRTPAGNALRKEPPREGIRKIPGENNLFIFGDLQLYLRLRDLDSPAIISRQGRFMSAGQG